MSDRKPRKKDARPAAGPRPVSTSRAATGTAPLWRTRWVAVILTLLVVVFFHEVVVGGKTFVSPDTTAPAGFVRVGEHSLWQDHVYPLWNPYVFLGMPSFASGTYNPLIYPPDWPVAIVQKLLPLPELTWMLLYYVLGALFTFLLAREWGARPEGALLGAAAFVFAPNLVAVGSHGHGSQLVNSAYLPLMLWLAARWMRRGRLTDLAWLALAGGFQMLRGHVQICFYTWMAIGLYAVVDLALAARREGGLPARALRLLAVLGAAALAFGLAGFYNLPLRDYAAFSIRGGGADGGVGMSYATGWSMAPYELPTLVFPGWVGFGGQTYWGGMPFTDYPNAYVGLTVLLLALPAFLANGAPRVFALLLAVLSLLISFGRFTPFYGFLYDHLPLFSKFRIPVMAILLFQIAAALGIAWGWSRVLERDAAPRGRALSRLLVVAAGALVAGLVIGVLAQDAWRAGYVGKAIASKTSGAQAFPPELANAALGEFTGGLARVLLLGLGAVAVAWMALRGRLSATSATALALLLVVMELWPVSGRVMKTAIGDPVQKSLDAGRDDVVEFLEKAGPPGTFRIFTTDGAQSNRYAGFGIASIGGYHAAKPRLAQDLIDAGLDSNLGWMRLLNVRYIVLPQPLDPPPAFLKEVFRGSAAVYENLLALPRATVLGDFRVVRPARAILDSVRLGTSESDRVTFLEQDPGIAPADIQGATARVAAFRLNDLAVDVTTPHPAILRVADLWHPDWAVTVDGKPARLLKADYLLRGVVVPAGAHHVEFRFHSRAIRQGLMLSLGSLVVILALFGVDLARRRRRAAPRPAEAVAAP